MCAKNVTHKKAYDGFELHTKQILTGMEDKEDWFQLQEVCKLLLESSSNILPVTADKVSRKQCYLDKENQLEFNDVNLIFATYKNNKPSTFMYRYL